MRRATCAVTIACLVALSAATRAAAAPHLDWEPCSKDAECATAELPRDYSDPSKGKIEIAVTRVPATDPDHRIGSLFINFGGPGFGAVDSVKSAGHDLFPKLNQRYDLIGFDPRGTGESRPAIDCHMNGEAASKPLPTPSTSEADLIRGSERLIQRCLSFKANEQTIPYVTTGNVARDLNRLRAAVGERRLDYLGFSYGTVLGATYQALFPDRVGRMAFDGPVDLLGYYDDPLGQWFKQVVSSQDVLEGFFRTCKRQPAACSHFGDKHPARALAALLEQVNAAPLPAGGKPLQYADGDDLLAAVNWDVYGRQYWGELASALRAAEKGHGKLVLALADGWWGRLRGSHFDPGISANMIIAAVDQAWPTAVSSYLETIERTYSASPYLWWIGGSTSGIYANVINGLFPVHPNGLYRGPFENSGSAPTTLVVATTHDPLTPYGGAKAEARQLGNAVLLTMKGYTHTAYLNGSGCIDRAIQAYLLDGVVPDVGTVCQQHVEVAPPRSPRTLMLRHQSR